MIARRKRALRLRRIRLAKSRKAAKKNSPKQSLLDANKSVLVQNNQTAVLPFSQIVPSGWVYDKANRNEFSFKVSGDNGEEIGSASLTVVTDALKRTVPLGRTKTIGGVSTTVLRRTVIDRMIRENGWVENDFHKNIGGKKVYVVVAKSTDVNNQVLSRTFYFAEVNGRIYNLATKARKENSDRLVKQSEKIMESLQNPNPRVQQAKNK